MKENAPKHSWNGIDLDKLRHVMDPPADAAIKSLYRDDEMDHLRKELESMARNDSVVPADLPRSIGKFVEEELNFEFSEEDIRMFNAAHLIWKDKGMKFVFVLFFRALPYTYMAEKPANVLRITKLLITQPERRIFETAQFVFDVMDKDWWMPDKRGILTATKVRLMHAAMRHVILHDTENPWNMEWGMPITQEDLVATNQTFSLEFIKGVTYVGDMLTPEEQKAWFYTWKKIGQIMGVQEKLLCDSIEEAWDLQHAIYDHLFHDENYSGVMLAKSLVEALHHFHMPTRLTLLMMKKMLADEQFPDCFDRMLGPSYREEYPELFAKHDSPEDAAKHQDLLNRMLTKHLVDYHNSVSEKKEQFRKKKPKLSLLARIIRFLTFSKYRKSLIDRQLEKLHALLHREGQAIEKLEERELQEAMAHVSGLMIPMLTVYFRQGKKSGFRIPEDLQEHWGV